MASHHWTEEEKSLVRNLYTKPGGVKKIMRGLNITAQQVWTMANRLGLRLPEKFAYKHHKVTPELPRIDLLKTMICPGINIYGCGKLLRGEHAPTDAGTTSDTAIDLYCIDGHRFIVR